MKVSIFGATSQSTPILFSALAGSPEFSVMEFTLVARSLDRLASVARAIRMLAWPELPLQLLGNDDAGVSAAIEKADVVLMQYRYGGLAGREFDESFPHAFGICGDEGLGPGGLSAAWRTWRELSPLLRQIQQLGANPEILLLTSPGSLLARLAHLTFPELCIRAICELPWTTVQAATKQSRTTPEDHYDYFGINHLGWVYGLPDMAPVALKYWRLDAEPSALLHEQMRLQALGESRASQLRRSTAAAFSQFASGGRSEIEEALHLRPAPWYTHAIAPYLRSLLSRESATHFFFSVPNQGWTHEFDTEEILEIPFRWTDGKLLRRPACSAPLPALVEKLRPFVEYERAAAEALVSMDPTALAGALEKHPWVGSRTKAHGLLDAILKQGGNERRLI